MIAMVPKALSQNKNTVPAPKRHKTKMFSPFQLKTMLPLQVFSLKSSSPSSSSSAISSTKLKNLIRTLVVSHMCRLIRALSKFKAIILDIILRDNYHNSSKSNTTQFPRKHCSKTQKIILGSFRLHYNWCSSKSSHVLLPVPTRVHQGLPPSSTGNSSHFPNYELPQQQQEGGGRGGGGDWPESELARYLQWLEEKVDDDCDDQEINEIDMMAEMFIANCHEKFRLEKQESDRRFQEMLARGL